MLGIEWLSSNAARWNFLEGTIIIQNPTFNVENTRSSPADPGKELSVRSFQRDDYARIAPGRVILPTNISPFSKEVLFHVIDNICNAAKKLTMSLGK